MKITVLTGSSNLSGTSNTLVGEFIRGALDNGHSVTRFDTAHLDVNCCTGCNICGMDGDCVFNDDMNEILDSVLSCDMLVFASPVYYFAITAPLKAVIDRFYSRTIRVSSRHLKTALIITCWNTDDSTINPIKWHYEKMVDYMNYEDMGMILGKGCGSVSMIPSHFYEDAYNLGKNL